MHKIKLILLVLILPAVAKSQDTIKLPTPIAKQIIKELVSCDSTKAMLDLTKEQLMLTEQKVLLKDNTISNYLIKDKMYEDRIENEQAKFNTQGVYVKYLEKDNKKLRIKLTLWKIGFSLGAATTVLAYLYLTR